MSNHQPTIPLQRGRRGSAVDMPTGEELRDELTSLLAELCTTLATLIDGLPNQSRGATALSRQLSLNPQLAWQIVRIANTTQPFEAVQYLPTSKQLLRFVDAADDAGVSGETIRRAREVCDRYHAAATLHAKDYAEFESLLGSLASSGTDQVHLKHRRSVFRGNAHIYGYQARTAYNAVILHIPDRPEIQQQLISVLGFVDLHATNPDSLLMLRQRAVIDDELGQAQPVGDAQSSTPPANATYQVGGARFVDAFESPGGPGIQIEPRSADNPVVRVIFPRVGRSAMFSYLVTEDYESTVPRDAEPAGVYIELGVPSEKMVLDVFVPQGWMRSPMPTFTTQLFTDIPVSPDAYRFGRTVPVNPTMVEFTGVVDAPRTPDVPRLTPAIRAILKDRGWYGTKFNVYRATIDFPILYAKSCLRLDTRSFEGA